MSISDEIFKLCRLCQSRLGVNSILQDNLMDKILECTKIHLKENALHKICNECKEMIDTFHKFLKNVYEVNNTLRQKIKEFKKTFDQVGARKNSIVENLSTEDVHIFNKNVGTYVKVNDVIINHNEEKRNKMALHTRKRNCNCVDVCTCLSSARNYICKWVNCKKICSSAYTFKTHQMKHENKRPFLCAICGKGFVTKNSLNSHEKIHLDVKSYNCELCNIRFSVKSNLRAHEKKYHEGIKFYCTKVYISKASLERHESLHSGIKEYCCISCSSAFYTKEELLKHQKYHKGLRQHKCNECFKSFFEKHHLTIHLRSHTGERPYGCSIEGCGKSFTESQKLTRHLRAKHPN